MKSQELKRMENAYRMRIEADERKQLYVTALIIFAIFAAMGWLASCEHLRVLTPYGKAACDKAAKCFPDVNVETCYDGIASSDPWGPLPIDSDFCLRTIENTMCGDVDSARVKAACVTQ